MHLNKNVLSKYAMLLCFGLMFWTAFSFYPRWQKSGTEATLSWDVSGYYMYLPALLIYQDIQNCGFRDSIINKYSPSPTFDQAFLHEKSGKFVMKYTAGQAVVMLPFFAAGHLFASISAIYPADGFSAPYQYAVGIGMFLIALFGLYMLRKILLVYFKDSTVAIVLILYVFGTNYLNYSSIDQAMTHNSLFTIYCVLIWFSIRFYQHPKTKHALIIGLLCGLAMLIRPTEIIALIIPLFWGVATIASLKDRILFLGQVYKKIIIAVLAFCIIVSVQFIYWKLVTNEWFVYSYQDQGFSWLHPHIKNYLFSYKSGWLRYCPLMVLPFIGLVHVLFKSPNRFAILFYTFLALYITSAWDIWDYGGTAGRAMVQHYVILAFPLAGLIEFVNSSLWSKVVFYPIVILTIYLNIWWTYQAHSGGADVALATKEYYWQVIGRWQINEETKKLLDNPHQYKGFPKSSNLLFQGLMSHDSISSIILDAKQQHANDFTIKRTNNDTWMRAFARFKTTEKEWNIWSQCQFILAFHRGDELLQTNFIRVFRFLNSYETKTIYLDARPPNGWDNVRIQFWNAGSDKKIKISNLRLISFNDED